MQLHRSTDAQALPGHPTPEIPSDWLDRLKAEPWKHSFFSLLRHIGADPGIDDIGTAKLPEGEPFRVGRQPSLTFAPRELARIEMDNGRLLLRLFGLGMFGPNGPLPHFLTEIARERSEWRGDTTLIDFADIFHHRALTLFYRAWALCQATVSLDRPEEHFSAWLGAFAGLNPDDFKDQALPWHARLSAIPHLLQDTGNPDGLRAVLAQYFDVPVSIEERAFHWMALEPQDCGQMGRPGHAATLGEGAILGTSVPDRTSFFRIIVGPLPLDRYERFTPRGEDLPVLVDWVRTFFGEEFEWELELRIQHDSVPPAVMGDSSRLGWTAWIGIPPPDRPVVGMVFRPESWLAGQLTTMATQ
jgi:type VI secretion system protein ImpH